MAAAEPWIAAKLQVARSKKVSRGLQRSGGILDHALPELLGAGLQPQVSSGCRRAEKMGGSLTSSMERRQVRGRPRQRHLVWGPGTVLGQGQNFVRVGSCFDTFQMFVALTSERLILDSGPN